MGRGSWGGGCACNTPNITSYTETTTGCPGLCPGCIGCENCTGNCDSEDCKTCAGCSSGICNTTGICPYPNCNWGSATYYLAQMQFTPITLDNPNHTTLPINPQSSKDRINIGASNRNRWIAELNPQTNFIDGI